MWLLHARDRRVEAVEPRVLLYYMQGKQLVPRYAYPDLERCDRAEPRLHHGLHHRRVPGPVHWRIDRIARIVDLPQRILAQKTDAESSRACNPRRDPTSLTTDPTPDLPETTAARTPTPFATIPAPSDQPTTTLFWESLKRLAIRPEGRLSALCTPSNAETPLLLPPEDRDSLIIFSPSRCRRIREEITESFEVVRERSY